MIIDVTKEQVIYLNKIINADIVRMERETDHAVCHGADVILPDLQQALSVNEQILRLGGIIK